MERFICLVVPLAMEERKYLGSIDNNGKADIEKWEPQRVVFNTEIGNHHGVLSHVFHQRGQFLIKINHRPSQEAEIRV